MDRQNDIDVILAVLAKHPRGLTASDLALRVNRSPDATRARLIELRDTGKVTRAAHPVRGRGRPTYLWRLNR